MKVWSWRDAVTQANLEANTKYILLVLSLYMDERGGSCYPTIDTLMRDSSLARATVIKHLGLAEDAGFITRRKHGFKGQEWANNEYTATYPKQVELKKGTDVLADEKGSSTTELPSISDSQQKGSSTVELPFFVEGSSIDDKRQFNEEEKVVQQLNSNTSLNTPITLHHQDARAPARDDNADDDEFIKIFDEELKRAYGEDHHRPARIDDADVAHGYRKSGCSPEFFREVIRQKIAWLARKDTSAPGGLVYFRDIIPAEMKRAGERAKAISGADKAPESLILTVDMLGGDTPQNREWLQVLEKLRARHGDALVRSWFLPLRLREKTTNGILLTTPMAFTAEYLNTRHIDTIKSCAREVWPELSIIKIEPSQA